jgi:hypothetical protein
VFGNAGPELLRFFNALGVSRLVLLDGADLVGGEHGPLRMNNSISWSGNKLNQNEREKGKSSILNPATNSNKVLANNEYTP